MEYEIKKKVNYLQKELRNSVRLIELGFGEIQSINLENNFYHLPLQLLSSGFERFLKCYLCIEFFENNGFFPKNSYLKDKGHDILVMKKLVYPKTTKKLDELLRLLSCFGQNDRYYNLNKVTEDNKIGVDVEREWQKIEDEFLKENINLYNKYKNLEVTNETYKFINYKLISTLESFIKNLSEKIKNGELGSISKYFVGEVYDFAVLPNRDFGKRQYIKTVTRIEATLQPYKRTSKDDDERLSNPNFIHQLLKKENYEGEWPFDSEEAIIELRDNNRCIISIDGYDYALNGRASIAYNIELVNKTNITLPGYCINDFTKMTLNLKENH